MKRYNIYVKVDDNWNFLSSEVNATSEDSALLRFDTLNYQLKAVECFPFEVYAKDILSNEEYYVSNIQAENESAANILARKYSLEFNIKKRIKKVNSD